MKAEYKRDLNRNYLVMPDHSDGYQTEMLVRNESDGFIPIKKVNWDGETLLYYDITGKQSLSKGFAKRKIDYNEMSDILYSISNLVKECKRLFLDISGIVLTPDHIYRDLSTERLLWIFYPYERDSHEMMELAEFLLEHIDNGNSAVVKTAYELYRRAKEGSIEAENLYEILHNDEEEKNLPDVISDDSYKEKEFKSLKTEPEGNRYRNKVELVVDRLFELMKKKVGDYRPPENEFYDYTEESREEAYFEECTSDYDKTVLIPVPDGNQRRLISRDSKIPDADLEIFPCVLGSKRECVDILLTDSSVSRMHAQIDEAQGKLFIFDLNSSNGTYVNGKKIVSEEKEIIAGDEIRIGNVRFVLA
ncbi:MAG: DUF6382 domain-containing protein [Lachnospiraceae bacterium]|nr:DUF6382 domain-containing protein [Lachnospiraceae bacterium]